MPLRSFAALVVVLGLVTACGDDDDDVATDEVTITLVDYAYEDVPDSVPAGTRLRISNQSEAELHEAVVFRLPDDETRTPAELAALGEEELGAVVGGPPVAVLVQPPGGPAIDAVGDGTLTEPGRYLLLCEVPTGADPDAYMAAAAESQGGPVTGVDGGAPHLVNGMVGEITVTD